ncbi:MAG: aminoacyl-histidine dipeptidase [Eubacteriales bacterium]|nr:aminoacyl-histidine dipeptidase [Eubacteriales bacterium]
MGVLTTYEPKEVLTFFEEICGIPHGSGNVTMISDYLVNFAKERGLKYRQDDAKNVIIWKDGTAGYENSAPVIIQGHMDMVAVKESGLEKDMKTEGLDLEVLDGDWISAKGTSLGGDDGIAVAYGLALLDSDSIPHPPLEVVITVDEEIGMLGAAAMDCSDLKGRLVLNIDSEEEGIFTVSCAGGLSTICRIPYDSEEKTGTIVNVKLSGFCGGHSGVEINKGRLNSNIVMGRLLQAADDESLQLVTISGGEKENVISPVSEAKLLIAPEKADLFLDAFQAEFALIKEEYKTVESGLQVTICKEENQTVSCFTKESTEKIIAILMNIPNGIQRMNPDMPEMVQTSLNLGVVETVDGMVVLTNGLRSSSDSEKMYLLHRMESFIGLFGGSVEVEGNYPGWEYRAESYLRDICLAVYREQYGDEPVVEGIHAGLECGLFASKMDDLDCISYGPNMRDIHSFKELLSISSVGRTWELTKNILKKLQ